MFKMQKLLLVRIEFIYMLYVKNVYFKLIFKQGVASINHICNALGGRGVSKISCSS